MAEIKVTPGVPTLITSQTTTQVKSGPGVLLGICITETAAGTILVYDDVDPGTSNLIASFKASVAEGCYLFNCVFRNGLKVVTGAASKLTVIAQ